MTLKVDIFTLARYGVLHTVPVPLFHNREGGRSDGGAYSLAPTLATVSAFLSGMGRLDNWPQAIKHGNIGVSGMRDLEELATVSEIIRYADKWGNDLHSVVKTNKAEKLVPPLVLGKTLLAAMLFIGNRLRQQSIPYGGQFWNEDRWLNKYKGWLAEVSATAYAALHDTDVESARAVLDPLNDWQRYARQVAFFMTDAHAPYLREGYWRLFTHPFPEDIYEPTLKARGAKGRSRFGPYRERTFHPKKGFGGLYGQDDEPSLGPVNGQFPIRAFERAFWSVFV
ncbi:MAG: hypothetical protein HQM16_12495 [Deltaproteobacteria bacterium]|nr:hypothetical protein [Deltaproteobacteria bacterium]